MVTVTGISASEDASAVQDALVAARLPLDPLEVVWGDDDGPVSGSVAMRPDQPLLGNVGTGTGVPGLTSSSRPTLPSGARNARLVERLADLDIPDDKLDDYIAELEAGRAVVAYSATPEMAERVAGIFRGSGLANVKTF